MSTTSVTTTAPADRPADDTTPPRKVRRRGESSPLGRLTSHGVLTVAGLIALFPVAWLVFVAPGWL